MGFFRLGWREPIELIVIKMVICHDRFHTFVTPYFSSGGTLTCIGTFELACRHTISSPTYNDEGQTSYLSLQANIIYILLYSYTINLHDR